MVINIFVVIIDIFVIIIAMFVIVINIIFVVITFCLSDACLPHAQCVPYLIRAHLTTNNSKKKTFGGPPSAVNLKKLA